MSNETGCRAQADDHGGHDGIEKLARAARPGRVSFFHLESIIAVADVDRAVGAPFPAAVVNVEMMAMAVMMMTMPMMMTMSVVSVMPVMAVASTVPTVAAMPTVTVTACESLTGDGQRSRGQRQSSNRGGNDLVKLCHGRLLGWAERGSPCDDPSLEALAAMRCDHGHAIGRITQLV
jgi:hypothetical protein